MAELAKRSGHKLFLSGKPYTNEMGRNMVKPEKEQRILKQIGKSAVALQKRFNLLSKRIRRPEWLENHLKKLKGEIQNMKKHEQTVKNIIRKKL